jgi:dihydropteroate synthase
MGIVNVTPDSFFDGIATPADPGRAAEVAERLVAEGAALLDVGGVSTRPGAPEVAEAEELSRVLPALARIRARVRVPITIDTTRAGVARAALDAGADGINDVSGGTEDGAMLPLAASRRCGVVLMHRVTTPRHDRYSDQYQREPISGDVVAVVRERLVLLTRRALEAGVAREAVVIDPGLGFGKSVEQNLEIIRRTPEIAALGFPVLSGLSRKSFVGRVSLGRDSTPAERLAGTLALSLLHASLGADILRVHDVGGHVQALSAWRACHRHPLTASKRC